MSNSKKKRERDNVVSEFLGFMSLMVGLFCWDGSNFDMPFHSWPLALLLCRYVLFVTLNGAKLGKKVFPSYLPPDPLTKVLYELLDDMVSHKPHKCLLGWNVCKISQSKTGKQRFWRCGPIVARSSTTCHVCNPIGIIDARFVGQECVRSQSTSPRRATFSRSRPTMTSRVPVVQQPAPAAHPCPPRCRQSLPV